MQKFSVRKKLAVYRIIFRSRLAEEQVAVVTAAAPAKAAAEVGVRSADAETQDAEDAEDAEEAAGGSWGHEVLQCGDDSGDGTDCQGHYMRHTN